MSKPLAADVELYLRLDMRPKEFFREKFIWVVEDGNDFNRPGFEFVTGSSHSRIRRRP